MVNKSAQGALLSSCPSCGAISNLTRYILQDDYDEEGYVIWDTYDQTTNSANSGHVFNYYRVGNKFVTFDYTSVDTGHIYASSTRCWVVDDLSGIKDKVLREQSPEYTMHTIFIDRDPQRDRIVLLYQDDAWQRSCPSFEYHPFFEEAEQISETDYPSYVFDGSRRVEYVCRGYHRNGKGYCSSHRIHEEVLDKAVWDHTEKLREQYAAELKKVTQLQK